MEQYFEDIPAKIVKAGGLTEARQIANEDTAIFEEFRDIIEQKLQSQFQIPADFQIQPAKVRTQVVAGTNYYFHVRLPNDQYAHVRIFQPLKGHALDTGDRSSYVTVDNETTAD